MSSRGKDDKRTVLESDDAAIEDVARPSSYPLTVTAPLLLRLHELSWEALEHLVVALAVRADHALEARPFGRGGQAQNGVDVVAFFASETASVYQAKRYEKFVATDLRKAVQSYTDGQRPFDARRLVIVTTADVRDTRIDLELARLRDQYHGLAIDLWGQQQLSDMLFALPDLVRRFFGEDTMRVFCRPLSNQESPDRSDVADAGLLEDYLEQLGAYLSSDLPGLVPMTLKEQDGPEQVSSADLATWLRPGRHMQVAGGPGTGKSHILSHTTLGLAQAGWLPILMRAGIYEGRLQDTLEECVAPFSRPGLQALLQAAQLQKVPIVLLVDGINECPAQLQERLVHQISSWSRVLEATVLSSSQEFVRVPEALRGARLKTTEPDTQQRRSLVCLYSVSPETDALSDERFAPFGTAFELSLAARLTQQLVDCSGSYRPAARYSPKRCGACSVR
ncbi:restriction endonuclease [Streptomyces sp. NPDC051742]|uniref:restriction endonuclease n=1 Tax=unclassified Streptomyces TaxID=2593676 RepID=UPI003440B440